MDVPQQRAHATDEDGNAAATAAGTDLCVILNPGSGKKKDAAARERIEAALARHPGRFELRVVPKGGHIAAEAERAASDGFATLVAAGGDGTISSVAAVAHEAGRRLGVLPMGTFNYFARGLDLPPEVEDAVDLIAAGAAREVPIAKVNGKLFLNNASLGIYPAILEEREGTYRRWGRSRLAAHWSVLMTFMRFHHPLTLKVVVDGKPIRTRTPLAFVARSAFQIEVFDLEGADELRDGKFAVFLAPDCTRWQLLLFALRLAWRSMERGRDFELVFGREVDIETRDPVRLVARDGERERMHSPFRFRIDARPLAVIAPPEPAGDAAA